MGKRRHPLKRWMDDTKTTAATLARALDVSPAHVSNLIHGKRHMTMPVAIKAATVTGLPVEILLNDPKSAEILKLYGERHTSTPADPNDTDKVA